MGFDVYTGTLGSGKSLDATLQARTSLAAGKRVLCNYKIKVDDIYVNVTNKDMIIYYFNVLKYVFSSKKAVMPEYPKAHLTDGFTYVDTSKITVKYLLEYYKKYHEKNKESETLLIIDEASILFNARTWNEKERLLWLKFFKYSRKMGFDVILISQSLGDLDKQIRGLFDYEVLHRKLTSYKIFKFLSYFKIEYFIRIYIWISINQKDRAVFYRYKRSYKNLYDTFDLFLDIDEVFND